MGTAVNIQAVPTWVDVQARPATQATTTTVAWKPSGQWGGGYWGDSAWGGQSNSGAVSVQAVPTWVDIQSGPRSTPILAATVQAVPTWLDVQAAQSIAVFEGQIVFGKSGWVSAQGAPAISATSPAAVQAGRVWVDLQARPATVAALFDIQAISAWLSAQCGDGISHGAAIASWVLNEEFEMGMSMELEGRGQLLVPVVTP